MRVQGAEAASNNKALLEQLFAQTALGNGQPLLDALADDVAWTVTASSGWSETHLGKESVRRDLIAPLRQALQSTQKTHALRLIAARNVVCVVGRGENLSHEGKRRESSYCWMFEFRAGQIVTLKVFLDREMKRSAPCGVN